MTLAFDLATSAAIFNFYTCCNIIYFSPYNQLQPSIQPSESFLWVRCEIFLNVGCFISRIYSYWQILLNVLIWELLPYLFQPNYKSCSNVPKLWTYFIKLLLIYFLCIMVQNWVIFLIYFKNHLENIVKLLYVVSACL